jgi:hypothetical protein
MSSIDFEIEKDIHMLRSIDFATSSLDWLQSHYFGRQCW